MFIYTERYIESHKTSKVIVYNTKHTNNINIQFQHPFQPQMIQNTLFQVRNIQTFKKSQFQIPNLQFSGPDSNKIQVPNLQHFKFLLGRLYFSVKLLLGPYCTFSKGGPPRSANGAERR